MINNGYSIEHFTHHSKHQQHTNKLIEQYSTLTTTEKPKYVKWRNDKKEWWIHTKEEWVANHILNRDKGGLPECYNPIDTTTTDNLTWILEITTPNKQTVKTITNKLNRDMMIPLSHIQHIKKQNPTENSNKKEKHEHNKKELTKRTFKNTWEITFKDTTQKTLWEAYGSPWKNNEKLTTSYATGWLAYTERILEMTDINNLHKITDINVRHVLESYYNKIKGTYESPGELAHNSTDLWNTLRMLLHESASKSFGHYAQTTHNPHTSITNLLYKWYNTIQKAINHAQSLDCWETIKKEKAPTLIKIPIKEVQPYLHTHTKQPGCKQQNKYTHK